MRHDVWVKSSVLPLFDEGKDLEIRTESALTNEMRLGDEILFNERVLRRVAVIRRYPNLPLMLQRENPKRIIPGMSRSEVLDILRGIYSPKAERAGIVVIELAPVNTA